MDDGLYILHDIIYNNIIMHMSAVGEKKGIRKTITPTHTHARTGTIVYDGGHEYYEAARRCSIVFRIYYYIILHEHNNIYNVSRNHESCPAVRQHVLHGMRTHKYISWAL